MIEVFINELSFHEQFYDRMGFTDSIRVFYSVFAELDQKRIEHSLFWDDRLFHIYGAVRSEVFISSLHKLSDKSLRQALIRILMNRLNARDWRLDQRHSSDDWFQWNEELVTDTSLAELAERKLQDTDMLGLLVNFPESRFASIPFIVIVKNQDEDDSADLDCVENRDLLAEWLEANLQVGPPEYDHTSISSPTDAQTILIDKGRFIPTSLFVQGRRVYREIGTGCYWCVDNFHFGNAAHLEVFNAQGRHIGEAHLDGDIEVNSADPQKRLVVG